MPMYSSKDPKRLKAYNEKKKKADDRARVDAHVKKIQAGRKGPSQNPKPKPKPKKSKWRQLLDSLTPR